MAEIYICRILGEHITPKEKSFLQMLSFNEQKTIMQYSREADRRRCLYGKYLLYYAYYNIKGELKFPLEIEYNQYGKPYIKGNDFYYNISHSENIAVCVVSDYESGIDAEALSNITSDLTEVICRNDEYKSLPNDKTDLIKYLCKLWTVKESYVKWLGTGFSIPFDSLSVDMTDDKIKCRRFGNIDYECKFHSMFIEDEFYITVCMNSKENEKLIIKTIDSEKFNYFL